MDYELKYLHVKAARKTIEEGLKKCLVLVPN